MTAVFVLVGILFVGLAIERCNAMGERTRLRWLKALFWAFVGMLGLGMLLTPAKAYAGVVVEAKATNGALIQLHDEVGPCVDGARVAVWTSPDRKSKVPGCHKVSDAGMVSISWLDGDASTLPAQIFKVPERL